MEEALVAQRISLSDDKPQKAKKKSSKKRQQKKQEDKKDHNDSGSSYGSEATEDPTFIDEETRKKRKKKYIKIGIITGIVLIIIVLAIALPLALRSKGSGDDDPNNPDNPIFIAKNNPYYVSLNLQSQASISGNLQTQNYFNKNDFKNLSKPSKLSLIGSLKNSLHSVYRQYVSLSSDDTQANQTSYIDENNKNGSKDDEPSQALPKLSSDWTQIKTDNNNRFISNLSFSFDLVDFQIARFTLTDQQLPRFSIPEETLRKPQANPQMRLQNIGFHYKQDPFSFSFRNQNNSKNIYIDTLNQKLAFMDKYIQMDFRLNSQRIFGLGERVREFNLSEGTYTMWSTANVSAYDSGAGRRQAYGVHPFILVQDKDFPSTFFALFFRNSNAQSPVVTFNDDGTSTLSYITAGGQIEAYFFLQGSAKQVITLYHNFIGKPALPPFWALGWQQASQKYEDLKDAEEAVDNYFKEEVDMPLDVLYFSNYSYDRQQDFKLNQVWSSGIAKFMAKLNDLKVKVVMPINAAIIANATTNTYFAQGQKQNLFIKSAIHHSDDFGSSLIASINGNYSSFMDWFHPNAQSISQDWYHDLYDQVQFDGLWLRQNEFTIDQSGEQNPLNITKPEDGKNNGKNFQKQDTESKAADINSFQEKRFLGSTRTQLLSSSEKTSSDYFFGLNGNISAQFDTYNLPFIVRDSQSKNLTIASLGWDFQALSLNATHYSYPSNYNNTEFNLHSLNGHMMAKASRQNLLSIIPDKRPFILTSSTFASSGQFTSHVLEGTRRTQEFLRYSVASIMNMNMFGIPHSGATLCGYYGSERNETLCLRWIQLATLFPLVRFNEQDDHPDLHYHNEPFNMKKELRDQAKLAMQARYGYLSQLYTCLFETWKYGGTCFDPLFYHFPTDKKTFEDIEGSFIVANSLKVSPYMAIELPDENNTYSSYFPQGVWVNLDNKTDVIDSEGGYFNLTQNATVKIHQKEGTIISYQYIDPLKKQNYSIEQLSTIPITLIIVRDKNGYAEGTIFSDYGTSQSDLDNGKYAYYRVQFRKNNLQVTLVDGSPSKNTFILKGIEILNAGDLSQQYGVCGYDQTRRVVYNFTNQFEANVLKIFPYKNDTNIGDINTLYLGENKDGSQFCNDLQTTWIATEEVKIQGNSSSFMLLNAWSQNYKMNVSLQFFDTDIVNVKWTLNTTSLGKLPHFEVPHEIVDTNPRGYSKQNLSDYNINLQNKNQAPLTIQSNITKKNFLQIYEMFQDDYLNTFKLAIYPQDGVMFGLGQRESDSLFLKDGVYTVYGINQPVQLEDGLPPSKALHGSHPVLFFKHSDKCFGAIFLKISAASDWILQSSGGKTEIEIIAIGGIGDLYVIMDQPNPDAVIERYYQIVGNPILIPQWALGWHQSRRGYQGSIDIYKSITNYRNLQIPLESQWVDRDYMEQYKPFTLDQTAFADLPQIVLQLHQFNQRFLPILDFAIPYLPGQGYKTFDNLVKVERSLIKQSTYSQEDFLGKSWSGIVAYPDFSSYDVNTTWWGDQLTSLQQTLNFDGVWLDMNEISNFCDGFCQQRVIDPKNPPINQLLQYTPGGHSLELNSLPLDAENPHLNIDGVPLTQVDTHSYQSNYQARATKAWQDQRKEQTRQLIMSRSTFPGIGKSASTWLSDNNSTQQWLGVSVVSTMLMGMFGMPFTGADICGFNGQAEPELCARWHTLGAFYPLSRNNKNTGYASQEPWQFDIPYSEDQTYLDLMRDAIYVKYSLVRYYYTYFFLASYGRLKDFRKTFFKPLFFSFPEDQNCYQNYKTDIMLGDSIKLSINTISTSETYSFYFPEGVWCNLHDVGQKCIQSTGQFFTLPSKSKDFGFHLREGHLIPFQSAKQLQVMTTVDLQAQPVDFHILGKFTSSGDNKNWTSNGFYVNDDGMSLNFTARWNLYNISVQGQFDGSAEKIIVDFHQNVSAENKTKYDEDCNAVNKNDYLNSIYIYNADSFTTTSSFSVTGFNPDGTKKNTLGKAMLDKISNSIIFTPEQGIFICLSSYPKIVIEPQ